MVMLPFDTQNRVVHLVYDRFTAPVLTAAVPSDFKTFFYHLLVVRSVDMVMEYKAP